MRRFRPQLLACAGFLALAAAGPLYGQAEFVVGSIIKNFELPQTDKATGQLKMKILGKEAIVMSPNRIQLRKLEIDLYKKGAVETRIFSEQSDYWHQEKRLTSDAPVKVEHPRLEVTANSMSWDLNSSTGTFKDKVRVVIQRGEELVP
jgi:hypothetical protein